MARNAIESEFLDIQNGRRRPFCAKIPKIKYRTDLKWPEIPSKVNFGHPKCHKKIKKINVAYRSEMARNAIKREFRTSKMSTSDHFVKNLNKGSFVLI